MVINMPPRRLSRGTKRQLQLLAASLALTALLPASVTSAEEVKPSQETIVEAEATNESVQNWLESEDYIFAAERIPTNRWDTPANVHVITAEEIENNHYQTVGEALSHVNGVFIGGLGMLPTSVMLNGNKRVLLLIDGRRMISKEVGIGSGEKSHLDLIPSMKMIERIEIVKGGMSALYGTDAGDGVINIITKKGTRNETTFDVNTGSWKTHNYEITNQGVKGKFSWFVTGSLNRRDYYKGINNTNNGTRTFREKFKSNDGYYNDNTASIRLDNRFDDSSSLTLTGMHRTDKVLDGGYQTFNNIALYYNFKEGTSTPGWLRYFDDYASKNSPISNSNYENHTRMQGIEYQNGWEFGRHKIIGGFEWHRYNISTKVHGIGIFYDGRATDTAIYLQDTVRLGNKWTIIPGIRFDHDSESGSNWSPKISANYRADDKTKFYGSWGSIYNSPSKTLLYANADPDHLDRPYYGNPNLRPERGHTITIGLEHNFDDDTNLAVNYFNSHIRDGVAWAIDYTGYYDGNGRYHSRHSTRNNTHEKRHGLEISFNKRISDKWRVDFGYSHINGRDYEHAHYMNYYNSRAEEIDYIISRKEYYEPNGYRIGVHYTCGAWKANLLANISEGYETYEYNPPKTVILDFNVSYDVEDYLTLYARARNFTNRSYGYMGGGYSSPGKFFQIGATCRF